MDIAVTQSQGLRNRHSKDNELNLKSDTFNKSNLNDKLDINNLLDKAKRNYK